MTHIFHPRAKWRPRPDWPTIGFPGQKWYSWGDCRVMAGIDPDGSWHLSISCLNRYPTWAEIKQARYDLCPDDITMSMLFPPSAEWVNIHQNCFHLHQIFPEEMQHARLAVNSDSATKPPQTLDPTPEQVQ